MSTYRTTRIATLAAALLVGFQVLPAAAQQLAATPDPLQARPPVQKGPLVFQPVQNGPVGAPEVKFTEIDNHFGTLVGGYFGWLLDDTFLIGGAGYWLADGAYDRGIAYGGIELGWYAKLGSITRFGARGLIGAGSGTAAQTYTYTSYFDQGMRHDHGSTPPDYGTGQPVTARYIYTTGFFVAEPQASFIIRLADGISIDATAGYRFIGAAGSLNDQLRGATGGVTVRFGGGR